MTRLLLFLITAFTVSLLHAQALQQIHTDFIAGFNKGDMAKLTSLFYYPPKQLRKVNTEDSLVLAGFFSKLQKQWGDITTINPASFASANYIKVSICTADSTYWSKQTISDSMVYKVSFKNKGECVVGYRIYSKEKKKRIAYFDIYANFEKTLSQGDLEIAREKFYQEMRELMKK